MQFKEEQNGKNEICCDDHQTVRKSWKTDRKKDE